jgi:hypothetical protein
VGHTAGDCADPIHPLRAEKLGFNSLLFRHILHRSDETRGPASRIAKRFGFLPDDSDFAVRPYDAMLQTEVFAGLG